MGRIRVSVVSYRDGEGCYGCRNLRRMKGTFGDKGRKSVTIDAESLPYRKRLAQSTHMPAGTRSLQMEYDWNYAQGISGIIDMMAHMTEAVIDIG